MNIWVNLKEDPGVWKTESCLEPPRDVRWVVLRSKTMILITKMQGLARHSAPAKISKPSFSSAVSPNNPRPRAVGPNNQSSDQPDNPSAIWPMNPRAVWPNNQSSDEPNNPSAIWPTNPHAVRPNNPNCASRPKNPGVVWPANSSAIRPNCCLVNQPKYCLVHQPKWYFTQQLNLAKYKMAKYNNNLSKYIWKREEN